MALITKLLTHQSDDERIHHGDPAAAHDQVTELEYRDQHVHGKRADLERQFHFQDMLPGGHVHTLYFTGVDG